MTRRSVTHHVWCVVEGVAGTGGGDARQKTTPDGPRKRPRPHNRRPDICIGWKSGRRLVAPGGPSQVRGLGSTHRTAPLACTGKREGSRPVTRTPDKETLSAPRCGNLTTGKPVSPPRSPHAHRPLSFSHFITSPQRLRAFRFVARHVHPQGRSVWIHGSPPLRPACVRRALSAAPLSMEPKVASPRS